MFLKPSRLGSRGSSLSKTLCSLYLSKASLTPQQNAYVDFLAEPELHNLSGGPWSSGVIAHWRSRRALQLQQGPLVSLLHKRCKEDNETFVVRPC